MEICCASNMPVSEDISSFCEVNSGSLECVNCDYGDNYINDLGNHFNEFLNIQAEKQKSIAIPSPDDDRNCSASQEDACKNSRESESARMTSKACLAKCATFPFGKGESTDSAEIFEGEPGSMNGRLTTENSMLTGGGQSPVSPYSRSKSLPTPSKLISAMKGSRERLGAPPRKLAVKWAPDVYDPIPTSVSHVPNNRPQRHKNDRKNGKNKHKGGGKASRGNKGKDKKQARKYAGSSNRCFKPMDNLDTVTCYGEPQTSAVDFDVDSPDPFCGHSFLKKSVTQLHFPVAEAT